MADLYIPDISKSQVKLRNRKTGITETLPITAWPQVYNEVLSRSKAEPVVGLRPNSTGVWGRVGRVYVYGSAPLQVPVELKVELPVTYGKTARFKERRREGEILFTPRSVGVVSERIIPPYTTNTGVVYDPSWTDLNTFYGGVKPLINEVVGYDVNYGNIHVMYTKSTITGVGSASSLLSMVLPGLPEWPSVLNPPPSTAIVTSAAASAEQGYWDLLTELVELPETLGFLRQSMNKILMLTDEYKTAAPKYGPLRKVGTALSKHWLQYRYALMPIFYSINDVMEVFRNFQRVYGKYPLKEVSALQAPSVNGYSASGELDQSLRCLVKNRYDALSFTERLLSVVGINPLATLWEISPFSFVLDWVINTSDFIAASTGPHVHSDQASCWSSRTSGVWEYTTSSRGTNTITVDTYSRIPIQLSDHIGLTLDIGYGWKRQVDTAALSFSILSSKARSLK